MKLEFRAFDRKLKKWVKFFPYMLESNEQEVVVFTGAYDKFGVKIFEGDILKIHKKTPDGRKEWHGAVEYDGDCLAFVANGINCEISEFLVDRDKYEVVGSIYSMSKELAGELK